MLKSISWTSLADNDLSNLLEFLFYRWNRKVTLEYIENLDYCISIIQKNPDLFPFYDDNLKIRKCVVTSQNTIFYSETENRIVILRLYDSRQNPNDLKFNL